MSKTLIILLVVGVLVVLVGGGLAWAKHRGYCHRFAASWIQGRIAGRLDLNEPQRERLKVLAQTLMGLREQWHTASGQGRGEFLALLDDQPLDRARAGALLESWHQAWQARGPELVAAFADFSDSLSPPQRDRLRGMIERRTGGGCCH